MSIDIGDLSDEQVSQLTKVLARRPEHGIALPSRRWLVRQEEKMKQLPKNLLRPSNPLKRLALKIADSIDADILDPQAVLCKIHVPLNAFLIRRVFLAVAYEVTVHTDALRSWPGRTQVPDLSAFVGRMDSISALWTPPQLFHQIYGTTPFDSHQIFVQTGCEACILAAIGASGRILADIRAGLVDRVERRRSPSDKRLAKPPRLVRVVDSWIEQLRKRNEDKDRSEECKALSDDVLEKLRQSRAEIRAWRSEQRRMHLAERDSRPKYNEMQKTKHGSKITPLASNGHKRRTRHGIPVALADVEGAEYQRNAARYADETGSIYRPDSLCDASVVNQRQSNTHSLPTGGRPGAPEPRYSGPSNGSPTASFIQRFEDEVSLDPYDDAETEIIDERDYDREEASRVKVANWYENRLAQTQMDVSTAPEDNRSVISMVHPAFRAEASHHNHNYQHNPYSARSAVPPPLHIKRDRVPDDGSVQERTRSSEWTDATVYTVDPSEYGGPGQQDAPPVPRVPTAFRDEAPAAGRDDRTPSVRNDTKETTPFPQYTDPFVENVITPPATPASSSRTPLNWPAPPQGGPPLPHPPPRFAPAPAPALQAAPVTPPRMKPNPKRYLFNTESDAGSRLSVHQRAYVRDRKQMKEYPVEMNPFASPRALASPRTMGMRTPTPLGQNLGQSPGQAQQYHQQQQQQQEGYYHPTPPDSRAASAVPSLGTSHGNTINSSSQVGSAQTPPTFYTGQSMRRQQQQQATAERDYGDNSGGGESDYEEGARRAPGAKQTFWGRPGIFEDTATVLPDESASNLQWRRRSSVTNLGQFM